MEPLFLVQVIIPISISRVNQFDAARLDVEMSAMLKEQLVKVFSLMKVLSLLTPVHWMLFSACIELKGTASWCFQFSCFFFISARTLIPI
jgi:hypothetical protein